MKWGKGNSTVSGKENEICCVLTFLFSVLIHGLISRDSECRELLCSVVIPDKCLLSVEPAGEEEGKEAMTPRIFCAHLWGHFPVVFNHLCPWGRNSYTSLGAVDEIGWSCTIHNCTNLVETFWLWFALWHPQIDFLGVSWQFVLKTCLPLCTMSQLKWTSPA